MVTRSPLAGDAVAKSAAAAAVASIAAAIACFLSLAGIEVPPGWGVPWRALRGWVRSGSAPARFSCCACRDLAPQDAGGREADRSRSLPEVDRPVPAVQES